MSTAPTTVGMNPAPTPEAEVDAGWLRPSRRTTIPRTSRAMAMAHSPHGIGLRADTASRLRGHWPAFFARPRSVEHP